MDKVKEMVMNDRRITIREVVDDVGISIGSCHEIFSNVLGMKRVAAKLLNFEQKQQRMEVAQKSLNEVNNDAELLKCIIVGDKTWIYGYDVETNLKQIV